MKNVKTEIIMEATAKLKEEIEEELDIDDPTEEEIEEILDAIEVTQEHE